MTVAPLRSGTLALAAVAAVVVSSSSALVGASAAAPSVCPPGNPAATGSDPRTVGLPQRPQWAPDGRGLAFSVGIVLWQVGLDGKGLRVMATVVSGATLKPDWSSIVYVAGRGRENLLMLCSATPDGTLRRPFTAVNELSGSSSDLAPAWARDGKRVAVARYFNAQPNSGLDLESWIYVLDARGRTVRKVTGQSFDDVDRSRTYDRELAWSPDGKRLAVTGAYCRPIPEESTCGPDFGGSRLYVVDVASGARRDITPAGIHQPKYPAWSPSADRIAFAASPGGVPAAPGSRLANYSRLYDVRPDGSEPRELVMPRGGRTACGITGVGDIDQGEGHPAYSRDGAWLAFDCSGGRVRPNIYVVPAAGGAARPVIESSR